MAIKGSLIHPKMVILHSDVNVYQMVKTTKKILPPGAPHEHVAHRGRLRASVTLGLAHLGDLAMY